MNGEKQYIIFTGYRVMGLNPKNGKRIWKFTWKTKHDCNAANPIVINGKNIFITSDYNRGCAFLEIKGKRVKKLWENKNIQSHFNTPIYYNGYIYGITLKDHLKCISPETGEVVWEKKGFERGGIIIVDDVIIALGGKKGNLVMVEAKPKFKELSRITPLGGKSWSPPVIADKKLIIRNLDKMTCLDLAK